MLLTERNRQLETLREAETRSAILDERMRIAREVDDVVGHSLVAITLQARVGAEWKPPRSPTAWAWTEPGQHRVRAQCAHPV